ncbi:putative carboxypeptidase s precursor [Naematelia encephala]|uniref:Putative carboxypeptidase s n=1 Tax=Naematelia encephala TaxID=71784 RepID=A0A1Y2B6R7_9TREE|nr:putative carboxypeptidase s precursor [Naematelia encephala]
MPNKMSEKIASLPLPSGTVAKPAKRSRRTRLTAIALLICASLVVSPSIPIIDTSVSTVKTALSAIIGPIGLASNKWTAEDETIFEELAKCPKQPKAIYPKMIWNMTDHEKIRSIDLLSQAVQIPTESFDDNGDPEDDPRWKPFVDFQGWLKKSFPLVHEKAKIEFINTLGILVTIEGTDPSLKPLLLMSHYDVVPAPPSTFDRWTHGAFSGFSDGTYVWGRGAADDKTLLVAQWEAITHLLANGFVPRRTIILTHGFDEEVDFARRGQGHIAPFLEERYGFDSLLMVIDEGVDDMDDMWGAPFAVPAMGEKGYMDIVISVATAGGHSSVPPVHTGIGIMSQVVSGLENNPFPVKLTPASPILTGLFCASEHSPSFPKKYSKLLHTEGPKSWPKLAQVISSESRRDRAMLGTTTAVDVINGGVKVNALPELVTAHVNFRIDFSESVDSTQKYVAGILEKVAKKNGLHFSAFKGNSTDEGALEGKFIRVEMIGLPLEPAPRSPSTGGVWELFAGTVKGALQGEEGAELIVAPYAMTGNTDCRNYYNLTKNIYRFMGAPPSSVFALHTVDEKSSIEGHYSIVRWIHAIVQNADAYSGEE